MPDISLVCISCQNGFYFSERDQDYFKQKGYTPPKRCWTCRQQRKNNRVRMTSDMLAEYGPPPDYSKTWADDGEPAHSKVKPSKR